uniref:Uncharacterized protein n=1 Tax=Vespula pensylvanica TaxID=30213 RepID=A0A834JPC0_VESPE|nr:hypothetical protein H0235_017596 [Vespula pensylvanica]
MGEIGNDKENLGAINNDSKKEDLLIDVEEEKDKKGDTRYEDVQGECKDYSPTLADDLFDDRFYLDNDDSTDKFNSNHIDVCPWPNIDFVNFDLNSTISNTVYLSYCEYNDVICYVVRILLLLDFDTDLYKMHVHITIFPTYQVDGYEWRGHVSVPLVSDFEYMKGIFSFVYPLSNQLQNQTIG